MNTNPQSIGPTLKRISNEVVIHSALNNAILGVEFAIEVSPYLAEPLNTVVIGESGCGKSTLCDHFLQQHGSYTDKTPMGSRRQKPILHLTVPSPVTVRSLASSMLRSLEDPLYATGTAAMMTARLIEALNAAGVLLILLDEFQHLFSIGHGKSGTVPPKLREVQDWLKTLINQCRIPIVLVGMPDCLALINSEPQIARRFPRVYHLPALSLEPGDDGSNEFQSFAVALAERAQTYAGLKAFADFRDEQLAKRLYAATLGIPDKIKFLIVHATHHALRTGADAVTSRDLEREYRAPRGLATAAMSHKFSGNPFSAPIDQIKAFLNILGRSHADAAVFA